MYMCISMWGSCSVRHQGEVERYCKYSTDVRVEGMGISWRSMCVSTLGRGARIGRVPRLTSRHGLGNASSVPRSPSPLPPQVMVFIGFGFLMTFMRRYR